MSGDAELRVVDEDVEIRLLLPAGRLHIRTGDVDVDATDAYNIADLEAFATALARLIDFQARGLDPFADVAGPEGLGVSIHLARDRHRPAVDFLGEGDRTGLQVRRVPGGPLRIEAVLDDRGVSVTAWVEAAPAALNDLRDQVAAALGALRG
jgi:hypothetical protein